MLIDMHRWSSWIQTRWFPLVLFMILSFVLYGNSLVGEFVYDDAFFYKNGSLRLWSHFPYVFLEPALKSLGNYAPYRPITFATFALNFLLTGESPFWFHLVNVVLNGLGCWLLYRVIDRLFGERALAWFCAFCFAFFPIHTESIAYIKARDELLVACFGLSAWLAFLRATESSTHRTLWSVVAGALSLMSFCSKETSLVFPGVFGGSLLLLQGFRATIRAWTPLLFQMLAIATFIAVRAVALHGQGLPDGEILYFGQNPLGYMTYAYVPWTAFQLLFIAIMMTYVPWNLSATYGFAHVPLITSPFQSWMAIAGVVTLILFCSVFLWPRLRRSPIGVGVFMFFVLYFPFSKIPFYKSIDFFAERWLYAPSAGLAMIAGYILWSIGKRWKPLTPILCTAIAVAYAIIIIPRNTIWWNETRLGESMVKDAPQSVISYVFLGNNRLQYGRLQEATMLVTKGLAISRDHIPIHHIAAATAMGANELEVAERATSEAERLGGDELANVILRSTLLAKQHRYQDSLDHLQKSRWFDVTEYRTRMLLALNLWMLGRREEAREFFDWDKNLPVQHMTDEQKITMFETY